MLNERMLDLGKRSSVIREIFEYGNKRRAEIGAENVFDFSLGNPSVPCPPAFNETLKQFLDTVPAESLHGYTSGPGDLAVRKAVAADISAKFGVDAPFDLVYMTCGAAASLCITLNALAEEGDEVIAFAPFFPEYRVFTETTPAKLVVVPCKSSDLQLDFDALEKAITPHTKALILNSPNNPSGVIVPEADVVRLAALLNEKQAAYGTDIFLIADEPYRPLVYTGEPVPYLPRYYDNTVVCYSFSKALSLPGERIGYIFVSPACKAARDVFAAVCGAGRALGYVCAPSLMQYAVARHLDDTADIHIYEKNRTMLYNGLCEIGYSVIKPDGAFYMFVRSPEPDAGAFCEKAKQYDLLLVPSDSFGMPGFVRIAYCVKPEMIERALPAFEKLFREYR